MIRTRRRSRRSQNVPIIINVRDRLEPMTVLLDWLERAGHTEIYLLDNASTYPPLLEFLATCSHTVVPAGGNLGHHAPWTSGLVARVGSARAHVVTDPDVVPTEDCPLDAVEHFQSALDRHPDIGYVGFGLRIDDLPDTYRHRESVMKWEEKYWTDEVEPGLFRADIDTTFALYRPGQRHRGASLRTGAPYLARHLPWYANTDQPTSEEIYYRDHLDPTVNTWDQTELPVWLDRMLDE